MTKRNRESFWKYQEREEDRLEQEAAAFWAKIDEKINAALDRGLAIARTR